VVMLKRKLLDMEEKKQPVTQTEGACMRIVLPEVIPPPLPPGAAE